MKFTSERIIPDYYFSSFTEFMLYLMHIKSYLALDGIINGTVLDYGCGLGYGTRIIGKFCQKAIGIDIDEDSIKKAGNYKKDDNVSFIKLLPNYKQLPFDDDSFDNVVSFQVIEHVEDVDNYLTEIKRVLKPGGKFICTTPNARRRLYPYQKPWNQHHLREYNSRNLRNTMEEHFHIENFSGIYMLPRYQKLEDRRVWIRKTVLYLLTNIFVSEKMRINILQSLWDITIARKQKKEQGIEFDFDRYINKIIISEDLDRCSSFFVVSVK